MKVLGGVAILLLVSVFGASALSHHHADHGKEAKAFPAYFKQTRVDHFDATNTNTFKQKYYINDIYFNASISSPVILYINGEGPIDGPPHSSNDEIVILAMQYGALIVTVEHRYFGESTPFLNVTASNLRFLSSRQALQDLADFVYFINKTHLGGSPNKWIHAGGSYSGALSAWFKIKFPHLTYGAIASSGVVHSILDFYQFERQWAHSVGPYCAGKVRKMNQLLDQAWNANPSSTASQFSAPTLNVIAGDFQKYIADSWIESVQYGFQPELCAAVNVSDDSLLDAYASYLKTFFIPNFQMVPNTYSTAYQSLTQYRPDGSRSWWWLKCSELAWFETPDPVNPIRSPSLSIAYYKDHCKQVFGMDIWPDVERTNLNYGGVVPAGHRIVYVEGSQDPWQAASVRDPSSLPEATEPKVVITCERCAHCVDLRGCPYGRCGGGVLEAGRAKIQGYISDWLAQKFPS